MHSRDVQSPLSTGLTSDVLPEVQKPIKPMDSQTGVSTNSVPQPKEEEKHCQRRDWHSSSIPKPAACGCHH